MTMLDADDINKGRSSQRRSRSTRGERGVSLLKIFLLVASTFTLLFIVSSIRSKRKITVGDVRIDHEAVVQRAREAIHKVIHKVKNHQEEVLLHGKAILEQELQRHASSLNSFSSLTDLFHHTELIALYFGASWCPSCLAFTNVLDNAFTLETSVGKDRVLTRQTLGEKKDLAIVHVSSDTTEEGMNAFLRDNWIPVPFDHPDRSNLKRFFRVCAEREQSELGINRQYEIPSLIIIDSTSQSLVTTSGAHDVNVHGADALDHWLKLRNVVNSMHDKYLKDS